MAEPQAAMPSKRLTGEQLLFLLCLLALTVLAWLMLLRMARETFYQTPLFLENLLYRYK